MLSCFHYVFPCSRKALYAPQSESHPPALLEPLKLLLIPQVLCGTPSTVKLRWPSILLQLPADQEPGEDECNIASHATYFYIPLSSDGSVSIAKIPKDAENERSVPLYDGSTWHCISYFDGIVPDVTYLGRQARSGQHHAVQITCCHCRPGC